VPLGQLTVATAHAARKMMNAVASKERFGTSMGLSEGKGSRRVGLKLAHQSSHYARSQDERQHSVEGLAGRNGTLHLSLQRHSQGEMEWMDCI
jgi:hypothetical protein